VRYLTPDDSGGAYWCRRLRFRAELAASITGALELLTKPEVWEEYGDLTPEQTADFMLETLIEYLDGGDMCRIGTICEYITATTPEGVLPLDGATLLGSDYPLLYASLDAGYLNGDGTFTLPDASGRVSVASGSGTGLTARAIGDIFGTEGHVLSVGELPSHTHTYDQVAATFVDPGVSASIIGIDDINTVNTGATGGDEAHNNLQPSIVWHKGVWYK